MAPITERLDTARNKTDMKEWTDMFGDDGSPQISTPGSLSAMGVRQSRLSVKKSDIPMIDDGTTESHNDQPSQRSSTPIKAVTAFHSIFSLFSV